MVTLTLLQPLYYHTFFWNSFSVNRLQQDLLDKSTKHSVKELALQRMQLGDTLRNILFPSPDEEGTVTETERKQFVDLCTKQNQLSSDVLAHHSVCQRVQEQLDDVRQQSAGKAKQCCSSQWKDLCSIDGGWDHSF